METLLKSLIMYLLKKNGFDEDLRVLALQWCRQFGATSNIMLTLANGNTDCPEAILEIALSLYEEDI